MNGTIETKVAKLEAYVEGGKETDKRHDKQIQELYGKAEGSFGRIDELKEAIGGLKILFQKLEEEVTEQIQAGEKKFQFNKAELDKYKLEIVNKFKALKENNEKRRMKFWDWAKYVIASLIALGAYIK